MSSSETIKNNAAKVIKDSTTLLKQIDEINEWNSFSKIITNIGKVIDFIEGVVITIENTYHEIKDELGDVDGEDKLNAAVELVDELLDLPFWMELIDEYVLKMVISVVVHYLNDKFGHVWLLEVL